MNLDVELVGGPLDGHTCEVQMDDPRYDVRLFTRVIDGQKEVLAYAFKGATTCGGERWVLGFLYSVAKQGVARQEEGGER